MRCDIEWNGMDLAGWSARFSTIRRSTVLQSYDYARAVAPVYGQRPRWGLIRIGGVEAGMVQMMEAGFLGLHALVIDRGPLWFPGFGGVMHIRAFFDEINRQFPRRFARRRRVIPELADSPTVSGLLTQSGFEKTGPHYTTLWLDLTKTPDDLRAGLRGNWRNALNKAERGPLRVVWDDPGAMVPWMVETYRADRIMRGYPGPEPRIMTALGRQFASTGNLLIGRALLENQAVAAILILCHGCSATYQIGWSDDSGRKEGGHYRLLWSAVEQLQSRGITDFDLGGINDDSAAGVSAFKDGMGGERITLAGLYA